MLMRMAPVGSATIPRQKVAIIVSWGGDRIGPTETALHDVPTCAIFFARACNQIAEFYEDRSL